MRTTLRSLALCMTVVAVVCGPGCSASRRTQQETSDVQFTMKCPTSKDVMNASYVGPYRGVENLLTAEDMARDAYCARWFRESKFPKGFVTIYGSSRIKEKNEKGTPAMNEANDRLYSQVKTFAYEWTRRHGATYPIMTGAGPGLMEAGSRGAIAAGKSIGYTTYYDPTDNPTSDRPYGGDPREAFVKYDKKDVIITDGLIFSSIAMRESAMILDSAAMVIAPGGTGTEWETFQILETLKSRQLRSVPVYLVGHRQFYWKTFEDLLNDLGQRGTIDIGEVTKHFEFVENAADVVEKLHARLGLR